MLLLPVGIVTIQSGTVIIGGPPPPRPPAPITTPDSFSVATSSATLLDVVGNDDPGDNTDLTLIEVTVSAGSVIIEGDRARFLAPAQGTVAGWPVTGAYLVRNESGLVAEGSFTVAVTVPGTQPVVCQDDQVSLQVGGQIDIAVLDNDDGDPDVIDAITGLPSTGTANIVSAATQIRYVPPAGFTGRVTGLRYRARRSADGLTGEAAVDIQVLTASVNRSGLAWQSGVWPEDGSIHPAGFDSMGVWRGRPFDTARIFIASKAAINNSSFQNWVDSIDTSTISTYRSKGARIVACVPLFPDKFYQGGYSTAKQQQVADYHTKAAQKVKSVIGPDPTIDLAWEWNGGASSYPWHLGWALNNGWSAAQWRAIWIAARNAWKSVIPGARFAFTALRRHDKVSTPIADIFPKVSGVLYTDFCGCDCYGDDTRANKDWNGSEGAVSGTMEDFLRGGTAKLSGYQAKPMGMDGWFENAKFYGTGVHIGEWAIWKGGSHASYGGTDSAPYVRGMTQRFRAYAAAGVEVSELYFHGSDGHEIWPKGAQPNNNAYGAYRNVYWPSGVSKPPPFP